jgi:hypothetical protein
LRARSGNSIIAGRWKRFRFTMRPLAVLFGVFLLASPLLAFVGNPVRHAQAGSYPSWNKSFHLHDGSVMSAGTYDWLNATGPYNPTWTDYDGDGLPGITIKKNVPPQRYHEWILYPSPDTSIDISGTISANIWLKSQGNESGTIVSVQFYDVTQAQFSNPFAGTLIGAGSSGLVGPFYSEFQLVTISITSLSYTLPQGHYVSLVVQRGDSLNDWLIVWYDRTDYDSYITVTSSDFISVNEVHSEDSSGTTRTVFSDLESVIVSANVSDPFGAYDIQGANVSVLYQSNQTAVYTMLPMTVDRTDPSAIPYWKVLICTLPSLSNGSYVANITARDYSGYPSWLNTTLTIVSVDHFDVVGPSRAVAGAPFQLSITARDQFNSTVTDWVGTVQLAAYKTDKITNGSGNLSTATAQFNLSDSGHITIPNEQYSSGEEQIYIKVSAGPRVGWSGLIIVSSGPVVLITISPPGNVTMSSGDTLGLTAVGRDSLFNVNTTWSPYWHVSNGIGMVQGSGLSIVFLATTAGVGSISCSNNATGATATVNATVVIGNLARINISSSSYPLTIHEGEQIVLTATGYDSYNNVVSLAYANWFCTPCGIVSGINNSATFTAGMIPQTGTIYVRLSNVIGSLDVIVQNGLTGPWLNPIPAQIRNEDTGSWDFSLTGYWQDVNGTSTLFWWVEDVNTSLYFISHDLNYNSVMKFSTQPDQSGDDQFVLWVRDPEGFTTFQVVQVRIIPINDRPLFVNNVPTELYVKFGTPYTFDYSYYVSDVDNTKAELAMTSDAPKWTDGYLWNISFDGLVGTFVFNRKDGDTSYFEIVTIEVYDPMHAMDQKNIVVRVTKDSPPDLNMSLPDVTIDEGQLMVYEFDLDDYFYDLDGDPLFYTAGFENIPAPYIDPVTHEVYFSAPGEWSGITEGTFIANDTVGALKVDTISVTVIPVNDAPIVNQIPLIQVKYDQPYYLYLSPYVFDPDNSMDSLTFQISDPHITKGASATGADRLEILFPASFSGDTVHVWMNVTDPLGLSSGTQFDILVTDNSPPTVTTENPDELYFTFPEDTYLNDSLMLRNIFYDPDSGDTISFVITSSGPNVHFTILSDGSVSLSASENWNGMELLNITATDEHGAWAFVQAHIVVTPVNDAPVAIVIRDTLFKSGPRDLVFDLGQLVYFYDPDGDPLTVTVSPGANAAVVGSKLYVTLPSGVNSITITLQASDGELTSNMVSVKVGIERTMAQKIGYPYSLPLVLLVAGIAGYFIGIRLPRPYALENLFLIHNDGRLVSHVTKEENTKLDKDVVSAMFTAVQEFVRDSFQKGEVGLKKLEIGDKNVVIEKGHSAYLALIYSGWPQKETFDMLPMLLRDIEERYRDQIERWNGTAKAVRGVDKMLQDYMAGSFKPGAWHEEEEIAEEEWVDILSKEA